MTTEILNDLLKPGATLTIESNLFDEYYCQVASKGEKVTIKEVVKTKGRWSRFFADDSCYIPEKIDGIKLEGKRGIWFLSAFEETKNIKQ